MGKMLYNDHRASYKKLSVDRLRAYLAKETWTTVGPMQAEARAGKLI